MKAIKYLIMIAFQTFQVVNFSIELLNGVYIIFYPHMTDLD